ncbi:MAG: Ger(x)C family spore germination protein [Bacillota bacterium]
MNKIPLIFLTVFLLAGCWDQNQLKDNRIVNGVSFDTAEESDDILGTVRAINIRSAGGGKFEVRDEFYDTENETVAQIETDLQNKVSGNMDVGKAFIILVGEELAMTKGIAPILEPIIRSTHGYISSRIVITEGKGHDILSLKLQDSPIVFEIDNLLIGSARDTYIPKETLFTVWNDISDTTTDVILPYIKKDQEDKLMLAGSSLFNGDTFTGHTLTTSQTSLLLLLKNELGDRAKLSVKSDELSQPLTISIEKAKTNIEVAKEDGKVICTITANLKGRLLSSYGEKSPKSINQLNQMTSKELSKKTKELTDLLVKANSDALGIGKELSINEHTSFNPVTWEHEYQQVIFKPKVNVNILGTSHLVQ